MEKALFSFLFLLISIEFSTARLLYLYYDKAAKEIVPSPTLRKDLGNWIAMSVTEDAQNQTGYVSTH